MMKNLVNAVAKAIVDQAMEQENKPKYHIVEREDGSKGKYYNLSQVVHIMSKKQFHDMVCGGFAAFKNQKAGSAVKFEELKSENINSLYYDLVNREDGDTTIGVTLTSWSCVYDGYEYHGNIQFYIVHANGAIVPRFTFWLYDTFTTEKSSEYKSYWSMMVRFDEMRKIAEKAEEWIKLYKVKEDDKYQYHLTPVNCTKHEAI